MGFRLSRKAEDDLIAIYRNGVEEFGVDQAESYFAGIEEALAFSPSIPALRANGWRSIRPSAPIP